MIKETFYFQHDFEPTSDPKIQALIGDYGAVGYGIFWRITEMLHSSSDHKLPLKNYIYKAIAKQMLTDAKQTEELLNACINEYELFASDGVFMWSERVNRNFEHRLKISSLRSEAGKKGAIAKQNLAKSSKGKERKGKESTNKDNIIIFIAPTLNDLIENSPATPKQTLEAFYDYYQSKGWVVGRSKMKDWKAALRNWIRNESNFQKQPKIRERRFVS